jgi:glucose-6-phosphate isomerase
LFENDRQSITLTIRRVSPFSVGVLIALFERAVGFYASLVGINAYHQPGVEAGKKAAGKLIDLELKIISRLTAEPNVPKSILNICNELSETANPEAVFKICEHLAANPARRIRKTSGKSPFESRYSFA